MDDQEREKSTFSRRLDEAQCRDALRIEYDGYRGVQEDVQMRDVGQEQVARSVDHAPGATSPTVGIMRRLLFT